MTMTPRPCILLKLIRKELFSKKQCFNGAFDAHSQRSEVPELLLALVDMILEGPNIQNKIEQGIMSMNTGVLISQLLIVNAVKRHRDPSSDDMGVVSNPQSLA